MKQIFEKIAHLMFPLALGESFEDLASGVLFFPNFGNLKHLLTWIFIYLVYFVYIIDGYFSPWVDTHYLPLPRTSVGPLISQVHLLAGLVISEVFIIRSYFFYVKIRYGLHSIKWFETISQINKHSRPMLFKVINFLFPHLFLGVGTVFVSNQVVKLSFERSSLEDYLVNIFWVFSNFFILRFTLIDLPLVYIMAYTCYSVLKNRLDRLLDDFRQPMLNMATIAKYKKLILSVADVNPLMKILSFTNGLFIIPFISLTIVLGMAETENVLQFIVKYVYFFPASFYSVRGMIMTSILGNIDSKSRILFNLISSRIARKNFNSYVSHRQLILIMDDLTCTRNHLTLREYSGSPSNRMDILVNVAAIAQFVMLLITFRALVNNAFA